MKSLAASALVASLLAVGAMADSKPAFALPATTVTVDNSTYEVTYFDGTYLGNIGSFNQSFMPWWGDSSKASQFAQVVGLSLGAPNTDNGTSGPAFAYADLDLGFLRLGQTYRAVDLGSGSFQVEGYNVSPYEPFAFATAQEVQAVPGPIPAVGAAAAFAWSRKLRRRLKRSVAAAE